MFLHSFYFEALCFAGGCGFYCTSNPLTAPMMPLWFCYVLRSCCLPESQDEVAHIQILMFCKWKK